MSQPLQLTMDECVRLTQKLVRAERESDVPSLRDLLAEIQAARINGLQHLKNSGISKQIKQLTKHSDEAVSKGANAVKDAWTAACRPKPGGAPAVKTEVKPEVKAEVKAEAPVKAEVPPVKAEEPPVEVEAPPAVKAELPPEPEAPPPLTTQGSSSTNLVIKRPVKRTGETVRDMVREKLQKVFDKGVDDNMKFLREQEIDTALMAEETEVCMYEKFDGTNKEYKARFRSLEFNLKDPKNPEFVRQVVTGQRHVSDLAEMEVKEMASDEVKKQRVKWQENAKMALMDERTFKNYTGKATQDGILKCPKCKSMKTEYIEVQTRSADEPTTKKCTCNNCDYRWKFC